MRRTTLLDRAMRTVDPTTFATTKPGTVGGPGTYNMNLYRGDSYAWRISLWRDGGEHNDPVDLTGAIVAAQIRRTSGTYPIASFECTVELPNVISMVLPAFVCHEAPSGFWDLEITMPGSEVTTILRGAVIITDDITNSTR